MARSEAAKEKKAKQARAGRSRAGWNMWLLGQHELHDTAQFGNEKPN
jgi:hypothetical protein